MRRPGAHRSTRAGGQASAPTTRVRTVVNRPDGTVASTAGDSCRCVTACSETQLARRSPTLTSCDPGSTTAAPAASVARVSDTATSKPGAASCAVRSPGVSPSRVTWDSTRSLTAAREQTTPLGVPVEPEVNSR